MNTTQPRDLNAMNSLSKGSMILFVALAMMFLNMDMALAEFPDLSTIIKQKTGQEPVQKPAQNVAGGAASAFDCPADPGVVRAMVGVEQVMSPAGWNNGNNNSVGQRWNTRLEMFHHDVANGYLICWYRPQGTNMDRPFLVLNRQVPVGNICEKKAGGHFDCHK